MIFVKFLVYFLTISSVKCYIPHGPELDSTQSSKGYLSGDRNSQALDSDEFSMQPTIHPSAKFYTTTIPPLQIRDEQVVPLNSTPGEFDLEVKIMRNIHTTHKVPVVVGQDQKKRKEALTEYVIRFLLEEHDPEEVWVKGNTYFDIIRTLPALAKKFIEISPDTPTHTMFKTLLQYFKSRKSSTLFVVEEVVPGNLFVKKIVEADIPNLFLVISSSDIRWNSTIYKVVDISGVKPRKIDEKTDIVLDYMLRHRGHWTDLMDRIRAALRYELVRPLSLQEMMSHREIVETANVYLS